ncbi:MAG: DinB family protein [Chitinophagaceae bacterium]|nr:DinB family protein [Chitinophagaceae bacterium]
MSIAQGLTAELLQEASNTRKMLERLPGDQLEWRPHEKSRQMGKLAAHIAEIPQWIHHILSDTGFDLDKNAFSRAKGASKNDILDVFEDTLKQAVSALENAPDEMFPVYWTFRKGSFKVFELPRTVAIRNMVLSHLIHHRGQLSVYLRLLNVSVPGMYGPSADEGRL